MIKIKIFLKFFQQIEYFSRVLKRNAPGALKLIEPLTSPLMKKSGLDKAIKFNMVGHYYVLNMSRVHSEFSDQPEVCWNVSSTSSQDLGGFSLKSAYDKISSSKY